MLFDSGRLKLYRETKQGWVPLREHPYGERTVGMSRYYASLAENLRTDLLVRIWRDRDVLTSDMCGIGENQYRILQVQHTLDEDGLQVTDLSLERVGTHFDLAGI
ncbi:hypothetical protein AAEU42_10110 [Pseudoflavonifractor phocaeensis]|uniref:hypothetical protein n=1 Tax=Pseudoflavonifractor phocaeensis TaxID=1870988 RepID=UPI00313B0D91